MKMIDKLMKAGQEMNFTKKAVQMANKYMKRDSTVVRYHDTPIKIVNNLKDGQ